MVLIGVRGPSSPSVSEGQESEFFVADGGSSYIPRPHLCRIAPP